MAKVYSQRLGAIRDAQFSEAFARLGLGAFQKAEPVTSGLFGQNVFVTTSQGEFVLRGAPHWVKGSDDKEYRREDRWQFSNETFFATELHNKTKAPVPWPYLHEETDDIFGWPFVVMPRMPGACFDERRIIKALEPADRHDVAVALGAMLAEMQTLTSPFAGNFDSNTIVLTPYPGGNTLHVIAEMHRNVAEAEVNRAMTPDDLTWLDGVTRLALTAEERLNTYVHCDYKLDNLALLKDGRAWVVSGLFDLHEARFGDGALDLVRQACSYLDTEPDLARVFAQSYLSRVTKEPGLEALLPLYVLSDRMKFWTFFTRPSLRAAWTEGKTFRAWAQHYLDGVLSLL